MLHYTIKDMGKVSGIKAHTIRIWEKRFNLFKPARTNTNIRYYDNEQLKKLLNVVLLLKSGRKISYIGALNDEEINEEIRKMKESADVNSLGIYGMYVKELMGHVIDFNKSEFDKTYDSCIVKFGMQVTIENILYPLLNEMGMLWLSGEINPSQEHFLSNIAKQKLFTAADGIRPSATSTNRAILFLPQQEDHEIGLLYANYLLMGMGMQTFYLGQRLPFENLKQAAEAIKPSHLVFSVTIQMAGNELQEYIKILGKTFRQVKIIVFGSYEFLKACKMPKNMILAASPNEFKEIVS
jgi:DNA-binding transcriptional MerR regulator